MGTVQRLNTKRVNIGQKLDTIRQFRGQFLPTGQQGYFGAARNITPFQFLLLQFLHGSPAWGSQTLDVEEDAGQMLSFCMSADPCRFCEPSLRAEKHGIFFLTHNRTPRI